MRKLAGFAAGVVALLACDASNPVAPALPEVPGAAPGGGSAFACVGFSQVPESEFFTEASQSRAFGAHKETLRVTIGLRVDPPNKGGLSVESPTDRAIVTVTHDIECVEPAQAAISTSLGFFVATDPSTNLVGQARACTVPLPDPEPDPACPLETQRTGRRVGTVALKAGFGVGDAQILVELGDLSVAPDAVPILEGDLGEKGGGGVG